MGSCSPRRFGWKQWLTLLMAPGILLAGSLACGYVGGHLPIPPYTSTFGSTGSCQSTAEAGHPGRTTPAPVVSVGPNTKICILEPIHDRATQQIDPAVH